MRNGHPDFALRQPLYRLFQGSPEDTGLSLLMRSPKDAVNGPILDERYIGCNLQQEKVHLTMFLTGHTLREPVLCAS